MPPFVRVTVDIDGVCQVERPHKPTPYTGKTFEGLTFFVNRVANTSQMTTGYASVYPKTLRGLQPGIQITLLCPLLCLTLEA
ncbi:hypothetical protein BHE90_005945 [Fusarium euwallaceae]|nr:hypothetical protein CDV36_010797 [Fusarium kuroshium]RSL86722.1 hypothetical protein CEP51_002647 [Fusarium floridanum]RTE79543.1 hypothetical protein BHE90_005945 [Fusarium euwallaceae]